MSRVIVLKIGGSVLGGVADLRRAVHEVQRWRSQDWRVLVVPSALTGVTDTRLREAQAAHIAVGGHALAALLGTGEIESAARLGLELDRAGIASRVLSPGACGLVATGDPLDAIPAHVNRDCILAALERYGVAVIPGFITCDEEGAWVTLGRGGSDLSALFLAHELGAEKCRLIKDVDGLYERDPALPGPTPARYESITWANALGLDGSIVQHKAIRYARDRALIFEVTSLGGDSPTIVGATESVLSAPGESPSSAFVTQLVTCEETANAD